VAELAALDLETGSPRWTLDAGPGGFLAVAEPESPWFAIWSADGNVRGYDGGSGAALATAVIPAVGQAPPGGVRTVGAVLLVVTPAADGAALTAYRRQDLQVLWRRPLAAGETAPLAQMAYLPPVTGCGPMACVPSASGFTVVDPATGRTRWRHATVSNAVYGAGVLVGDGGDGVVVLDWPTGRQIGARPGWRVVPTFDGSTASGAALIQRSSGSGAEPRTVDLRTVDLRTGAERAIGAVTPAPTRCVLARQRLACAAGDGSVRLWRIRG
jgi:outer membrane protein assembly factor BamB